MWRYVDKGSKLVYLYLSYINIIIHYKYNIQIIIYCYVLSNQRLHFRTNIDLCVAVYFWSCYSVYVCIILFHYIFIGVQCTCIGHIQSPLFSALNIIQSYEDYISVTRCSMHIRHDTTPPPLKDQQFASSGTIIAQLPTCVSYVTCECLNACTCNIPLRDFS